MVAIITLPSTLNPASEVYPTDAFVVDDGTGILKCTAQQIVDAGRPNASEAEALAGTDNFLRMSPLRVKQAIDAAVTGEAGFIYPTFFAPNTTPGTTDMTAAFQAAADFLAARGGGSIVCLKESGPFAVNTVNLAGGVSVVGDAEIVPIGVGSAMFTASGTLGSAVTLSGDAVRGANILTVASTVGWAVDDYVILTDEVSYNTTDASYKNGEMVRVSEITGPSTLTIYGKILGPMGTGNYTTANGAKIRKVTPAEPVRIEGLTFVGDWNSTKTLVLMSLVQSPVITGCRVANHGQMAFRANSCINPQITNNVITRLRDNLGGGNVGYGTVLSGPCMGGVVSGNQMDFCRHGFTTLGGTHGGPRGFKVSGNIDRNSTVASFDTHAAGSDYEMSDNLSINSIGAGVTIRAPHGRIYGNRVIRAATGIQGVEENLTDVTIEGNDLSDISAVGVQVSVACPNLHIVANELARIGNRGIRVFPGVTTASAGLIITDNIIDGVALTAGVEGIVTDGTFTNSKAIIARNIIKAGTGTPTYAIRTLALNTSDIFDNYAQGTFSAGAFDTAANTIYDNTTDADGGTVTQTTSKTNGVTLNKMRGALLTHNQSLNAGAGANIRIANNLVRDVDIPVVAVRGPNQAYHAIVIQVASGFFDIRLTNFTAGALGEVVTVNFLILRGGEV